MTSLVDYKIAHEGWDVMELFHSPEPSNVLYRYLMTASGVFIQAKRDGFLWASFPVSKGSVRGLSDPSPVVCLMGPTRIPAYLLGIGAGTMEFIHAGADGNRIKRAPS